MDAVRQIPIMPAFHPFLQAGRVAACDSKRTFRMRVVLFRGTVIGFMRKLAQRPERMLKQGKRLVCVVGG